MTKFQAKSILNSQRHVDAVLFYRRQPMETSDETFKLASMWIDAAHILSKEVD